MSLLFGQKFQILVTLTMEITKNTERVFYTTTKNKRTTPEKMEIMKFDPKVRKHVSYKETKIK